jgi:hypothetical protein
MFSLLPSPRNSLILVLAGGRPAEAGRLVKPCLVGMAEQVLRAPVWLSGSSGMLDVPKTSTPTSERDATAAGHERTIVRAESLYADTSQAASLPSERK